MTNRRLHVVHQLKGFNEICDPILSLMSDDELMKKMETMRDSRTLMNFLQDELGVRASRYSLTARLSTFHSRMASQAVQEYDTFIPPRSWCACRSNSH